MTRRPPFTALVTSLFAVWVVAAGLIPATSPRVQAQDADATLTFTCGTTPAPCEVQPGGTITVTGRAIRVCETFTALEMVNVAGVSVLLGTLSLCTSFAPRVFTVPNSVAPGVYTVRLRLLDPPSTMLVAAVQPLTVTGSTGGGNLSGVADCGRGPLPGALVELFSGTSFVDSTTAGRAGTFSFDVAPGQYTVRIKFRGEVCGGPAEPGNVDIDRPLDLHNHSWPRAYEMTLVGGTAKVATIDEHVFLQDQSTWFKFKVTPGSQVIVTLTGGTPTTPLPENYDLTLYKDIAAAFKELNSPEDLVQLQAESAPDAFAPDAFAPDAFAPDAFAPDAFAPDAFAPDAFAPDAFAPDAFAPDAFAPDAFAPDAFAPDAFAPDAFAPDAFAPDAFAPDAFAPDAFAGGEGVSPDAFAGAQTRSLIAVSAFNGTSGEGVARNTWDNNTDFYVRVRGRNGVFSLAAPFHLEVTMNTGDCEQVVPITAGGTLAPIGGGFKTLILTDVGRLAGSAAEKATLQTRIGTFAARPEVAGRFVNFGAGDARIAAAKAQSDAHNACPFAKNLLAAEIKRLIDGYRALNPGLEYIVFIGNDDVVPFQRVPDKAGLANEKTYSPPVLDPTASQASLKLGYVLTQDNYGSRRAVARMDHHLPLPDLAVGRLIETATDATGLLDAYLATAGGVVSTPTSGLVTGYDFLADAATAIGSDLTAGLGGGTVDALIQPNTTPPTDPSAWTADQLRNALLGKRHDLIFLGGHFSQGSALAADFTTRMVTTELLASNVDLVNAVIFSIGCHSGYNTVDPHAVQGVTPTPDWGQSFARKRATFIGGTGYQYGETEIIEYSERLYLEFSRALRTGSGPIPVGKALYAAKRTYLANTPVMRGIHEKALLESTLFGLPMLSVNLPGARLTPPSNGSIVPDPPVFGTKPGSTLGLRSAQVKVTPSFNEVQVPLTNTATKSLVAPNATYLSGGNGLAVNPGEPVLPLELRNVSVPNTVLRGIGFRGGEYTDTSGIRPLTGAPATELRTPHVPFTSGVPYPIKPWSANYFDALSGGPTRLGVTPMQFISSGPELGVRRQFSSLDFKLYYSNHIASIPSRPRGQINTPGLSASPAISRVAGVPTGSTINFSVDVVGEPAVGLQEVWVTYTAASSSSPLHGEWQSLDLTQQANPSHRFNGTLTLPSGQNASDVRYMVQAVNGVGLVTMATNLGTYYTPAPDVVAPSDPKDETQVELLDPPRTGIYREQVTPRARFTRNGEPLANQVIMFGIGAARRTALTNGQGIAQTVLTLLSVPGQTQLRASFQETDHLLGSFDVSPFRIDKQNTHLTLAPTSFGGVGGGATPFVAQLTDASRASRVLLFQTVVFVVSGNGRTYSTASITDFQGRAQLGPVPLPAGSGYTVRAHFGGAVDAGGGHSLVLENDRYSPSVSNAATLTLNRDASAPSCVVSAMGTDELGREYAEITVRDTGAGVASIMPTANSSNVAITTRGLSAISFPQGTTAPVIIRGTRIKPSAPVRLELKVTDAAVPANSLDCDPVVTTLNVGTRGTSETQTFK